MSSSIVDIFDDYGGVVQYKRVSARINAFNAEYSPENGYRIESSMQDSLSLQPGVLSLLREAIASGRVPDDIGLKDVEAGIVMVCTHRLLDKGGNVVRDASAAKPIRAYKDYEILETASLQRLMAKCGHGGELFDDDEDRDIADQAKDHTPPAQVTPLPVESAGAGEEEHKNPAVPAVAAAPSESDDSNATTVATESEETSVPTAMLRQIESLAERLDEAAPVVTSLDEAKTALKCLTSRAQSVRAEAQA